MIREEFEARLNYAVLDRQITANSVAFTLSRFDRHLAENKGGE